MATNNESLELIMDLRKETVRKYIYCISEFGVCLSVAVVTRSKMKQKLII